MIAPIRDTSPAEARRAAQRRKARRWIVESMLSRPDVKPRAERSAVWAQWLSVGWITLVAIAYFVAMLDARLRLG